MAGMVGGVFGQVDKHANKRESLGFPAHNTCHRFSKFTFQFVPTLKGPSVPFGR